MLETDARDRAIVALDCDRERALELAHELSGHAAWLKVGMTLYYAEGPEIVKTFKDMWAEIKKVTWPSKKELVRQSTVVIMFVLLLTVIVGLMDWGLSALLKLIIS